MTDASVVGVPDETWGERVVAVVATAAETLTERELQDAVRRRLAGYKVPRVIRLLPALPRTPTGKLLKITLVRTNEQRLGEINHGTPRLSVVSNCLECCGRQLIR